MLPNSPSNFNKRSETQLAFGGYYHDLTVPDGSWYDTENITCDRYPVLTGRCRRRLLSAGEVLGLCSAGGHLFSIRNNRLYADGTFVGAKLINDTFVIAKTDHSASGTFSYGDLNGDGIVDDTDVTLAIQVSSKILTVDEIYETSIYKSNGFPVDAVAIAGDIDKDGTITMTDVLSILRTAKGLSGTYDASTADLNGDGQISAVDALLCAEIAQGSDAEQQQKICNDIAVSGRSSLSATEIFARAHVVTPDAEDPITLNDSAAIDKYITDLGFYNLSSGEKQLVKFGNKLLIFPDKAFYDLDSREFGRLEAYFEADDNITVTPCTLDGTDITITSTGTTAPETPSDGDYWIDTSSGKTLKLWSGQEGKWVSIPTAYTKIAAADIGRSFRVYDGVNIKLGTENPDAGDDVVNGNSYIIWAKDNDYIVITAFSDDITIESGVKVKRIIPDMDLVCEHDNRLWGCSSANNEIYCSALGDPSNFYQYLTVSSDSWTAPMSSDGNFTGCIAFDGTVLFFKEKTLHRVYGSRPTNFKVVTTACDGVEAGSARSLADVGGVLYYNSPRGIQAFGSSPRFIGASFGGARFCDASACAFENKYYISMRNKGTSEWGLFAYDTEKRLWVREDAVQARFIIEHDGDMLFTSELVGGRLLFSAFDRNHFFTGTQEEELPIWYAETGDLLASPAPDKHLHGLQLRYKVPTGGSLKVYVSYDGGEFRRIWADDDTVRIVCRDIPLEAERADYYRLKIVCEGNAEVYAITRIYSL